MNGKSTNDIDLLARLMLKRMRNGQQVDDVNSGYASVTGMCFVTKRPHTIRVRADHLLRWLNGEAPIQHALASASVDEREFLLSGTSPEGWALMIADDEDE